MNEAPKEPNVDVAAQDTAASLHDEALRQFAKQINTVLDGWQQRLIEAVQSGRGATSAARMATARSTAELRRLLPPTGAGELENLTAEYRQRALSVLNQATHEIERNRYTLMALERQRKKLDELYHTINPQSDAQQAPAPEQTSP